MCSHKQQILEALKEGHEISSDDFPNARTRISDLRLAGFPIRKKKAKRGQTLYFLDKRWLEKRGLGEDCCILVRVV